MKVKVKAFVRSTHDEKGEYKFTNVDSFPASFKSSSGGFVIHMLHPFNLYTFDKIVTECHKYNDEFQESRLSEAEIALGLVRCLELGLARVA